MIGVNHINIFIIQAQISYRLYNTFYSHFKLFMVLESVVLTNKKVNTIQLQITIIFNLIVEVQ